MKEEKNKKVEEEVSKITKVKVAIKSKTNSAQPSLIIKYKGCKVKAIKPSMA